VFLIGDFTAMVGDPTGRSEARPRLTREEVRAAAETYQHQAFKVLDRDHTEVRYNSEWLEKLDFSAIIELGAKYTSPGCSSGTTSRDATPKGSRSTCTNSCTRSCRRTTRWRSTADIELGGTDQLFNLVVGRDVMPRYGKKPQMVMTLPLLEGTDAAGGRRQDRRQQDVEEQRQLRWHRRATVHHDAEAHVGR